MIGGSADLTGSNNTRPKGMTALSPPTIGGRFIHYGVREHGMASAMNGMALHGGIIPYSGTFLVFSDYCRPAIRLAALMGERVIHVMTHDSIGLGEDGPTHQPVEHLAALRAIPEPLGVPALRHGRNVECWQLALQARDRPSVLALTRQNLPQLRTAATRSNRCAAGAYELSPAENGAAQVSLFASGSEVAIAVEARQASGRAGRPGARRLGAVLRAVAGGRRCRMRAATSSAIAPVKVAVEAGVRQGWDAIIGSDGVFVGMSGFGASAPYKELLPAISALRPRRSQKPHGSNCAGVDYQVSECVQCWAFCRKDDTNALPFIVVAGPGPAIHVHARARSTLAVRRARTIGLLEQSRKE